MKTARNPAARKRSENIAFGIIKALSYSTIAILALIIGFILYRGLRSTSETRSTMLPFCEKEPDGLAIIVNSRASASSMDWQTLNGIFSDEYINWAKIDARPDDLLPAIPATIKAQAALLALGGQNNEWGGLTSVLAGEDDAIRYTADKAGAVAIVSAAAARRAISGGAAIKTVGLRRLGIAANSQVLELVGSGAIRDLSDADIRRLLSGTVHNWKEFDGPDLPVSVLSAPRASALENALAASGYAGQVTQSAVPQSSLAQDTASRGVSSVPRTGTDVQALPASTAGQNSPTAAYLGRINSTPGACGPVFAEDLAGFGAEQTDAGASGDSLPAFLMRSATVRSWNLSLSYLVEPPQLSGRTGGISTIILNTVFMIALTLIIAAPIGIAAAVYLVEYAKQGRLLRALRLGTETLAGIPSIIFGLFGMLFFVGTCHFGFGLLSGCLTLSLMILPTIIRTSEEALKSVPDPLREASLALGATKLTTIRRVVLPAAAPGIATGLILAVGRAVGETAALIFTMGSDYKMAKGLFSSARVLSTHIYLLFAEGISFDKAFSTAAVLLVMVLLFNLLARRLVRHMSRNSGGNN